MSHKINHDTFHLLILSAHANLHETNLPVCFIAIAVIIIYFCDSHAKAVFQLFDDFCLEF